MDKQTINSGRYRFGPFEFDLRTGELHKNEAVTQLPPQPSRILAMLVNRPGDLVTREEIQQQIWGNDTFVDFESGLNFAIKKIRTVLGDNAESPKFIETLPRRGYRFIAPLEKDNGTSHALNGINTTGLALDSNASSGNGESTSSLAAQPLTKIPMLAPIVLAGTVARKEVAPLPKVKTRMFLVWAAAGAVLVAAVGTLAFISRPTLSPPRIFRYRQLTQDGRKKELGTIVTDGSRVYFTEALGPGLSLAYVSTSGGETVPIPTSVNAPFLEDISPEGTEFLVKDLAPGGEELPYYVVKSVDGSARRLGTVMGHCGGWLPDGRIIYLNGNDIYLASRDGSESHKLVTLGSKAWWPRSSPDGKLIRFNLKGGLWEVNVNGTNLHSLLPGWSNPPAEAGGTWTTDGKYFVFHSTRKDLASIWAMREEGDFFHKVNHDPVQLTTGPMDVSMPIPSRDGRTIFALGALPPESKLRRYDSHSHDLTSFLGGISAWWVDYSRHGNRIIYLSVPEGTLWISKPDGSDRIQLTYPPMEVETPRWSPDGQEIVFSARTPGKDDWDIYRVSAEGGVPELLTPEGGENTYPDWSPDGNRIVFGVNASSFAKHSSLCILNLQNHQISIVPGSEGHIGPRWSPDGRYLAAWDLVRGASVIYDFNTRTWTNLTSLAAWDPSWSRDGKFVYLFGDDYGKPELYRVRLSDHKPERVMSLSGEVLFSQGIFGPSLSLAPDDSFIISLEVGTQEVYAFDWEAP